MSNQHNTFGFLLDHGFSPFPLSYGSKSPDMPWKAFQTEKATVEQCQEWDSGNYNAAIATGQVSGCFVVDIDGKAGEETIRRLEKKYGALPRTVTTKTGRGRHLFFRCPEDKIITNLAGCTSQGEVLPGVDIRGNGGCVIAPPSKHPSGSHYEWEESPDDVPIADAPDHLLDMVVQPEYNDTAPPTHNSPLSESFIKELIDKECAVLEAAEEGQRNDQLNKSGFVLGQYIPSGLPESTVTASLKASALKIGLSHRETEATIKSAINAGKLSPRVLSDKWDNPDMSVSERKVFALPECPHPLLGDELSKFVVEASACKSAPPGYVMASLLCGAAGLIGNARHAKVWEGWTEPTALWVSLVGLPSCNKSPALDAIFPIIRKFEAAYHQQYNEALRDYNLLIEQRKAEKQFKGKSGDITEEDCAEPLKPTMRRIISNDATVEKTALLLADNVKGLISQRDELSGMLANMEKSGGNDRHFYLEGYGGRPMSIDRVKYDKVIYVPSVLLSIIGSIQPDKLDQLLLRQPDDGLASRFLYVSGTPVKVKEPNIKPDYEMLNRVFTALEQLDVPIDENGLPEPIIVPLCGDGRKCIEALANRLQLLEQKEHGMVISHLGKLRGYAVRIAMVLQYLNWAFEQGDEPSEVDLHYVEAAIQMVEEYFYPMSKHCLSNASMPLDEQDARMVANWILEEGHSTVNAREVLRKVLRDKKRRDEALAYLEESGWIRQTKTGTKAVNYDVNPRVYTI